MGMACDCVANLPPGFYFHPTNSDLVGYYLYNTVFGNPLPVSCQQLVPRLNLYGTAAAEPWKIWKDFGGDALQDGEALYFFTTLKTKGSRIDRKVGKNGCWHGETGAADVEAAHPEDGSTVVLGYAKRFHYKSGESTSRQEGSWIMYEYSLRDYPSVVGNDGDERVVLCQLRKSDRTTTEKRKRKFKTASDGGDCESKGKRKIPRKTDDKLAAADQDSMPTHDVIDDPYSLTTPYLDANQTGNEFGLSADCLEITDATQPAAEFIGFGHEIDQDSFFAVLDSYLDASTTDNNTHQQQQQLMQSYSDMLLLSPDKNEGPAMACTDHHEIIELGAQDYTSVDDFLNYAREILGT